MIRLVCIANAVYVTVLSTQQAALLYDIGSPHGELETGNVELTRSCTCTKYDLFLVHGL